MKIAQVTTVHPGSENRISKKHAVALRNAGFEVHLVAPGPLIDEPNIKHHVLPDVTSRAQRLVVRQWAALRVLRDLRPEVVHVHDPELIPATLWHCKRHGIKFVYDAHENLVAQIASKPYLHPIVRPLARIAASQLERAADWGADLIVVAEDELRPLYPRNDHVISVRNYPWAAFDDAHRGVEQATQPVLGYVGSITEDRGIVAMLECAARSRHQPLLKLAGSLHPAGLAKRFSDNVEYLGPIPPTAVPEFLSSVDVGLCLLLPKPNYVNARSTKIYEYMMAEIPFLYSDFPAWVEEHGESYGIPVDPEHIDTITQALDALLDDHQDMRRRGSIAREEALAHYTYDADGKRLADAYRALSSNAPRLRIPDN